MCVITMLFTYIYIYSDIYIYDHICTDIYIYMCVIIHVHPIRYMAHITAHEAGIVGSELSEAQLWGNLRHTPPEN